MSKTCKILFIPLDNRPVSYLLPPQIADINDNTSVYLPPREYIGGLRSVSDIDKIQEWIEAMLQEHDINAIVCSLDTIAYGGLVPSRKSTESIEEIKNRLDTFRKIFFEAKTKRKDLKIYAFSSIMRISNNNINEEEKDYWDKYGELIFKLSYMNHQKLVGINIDQDEFSRIQYAIPARIIKDYALTRERNYNINLSYLDWVKDDAIDFVVFSQDDTAKFGTNVVESVVIKSKIKKENLVDYAVVDTGADEIPIDLMTRAICDFYKEKPAIFPVFSVEDGRAIVSRYENRSVEKSVDGQIALCHASIAEDKASSDLVLIVNTPNKVQNDHAMRLYTDSESNVGADYCIEYLKNLNKPAILTDIKFANGADPYLVQKLLDQPDLFSKLYAYSGWNTTGNSLGSSVSIGILRLIAEKQNAFNHNNFKKLLFIRFVDDWAFQSLVRQEIRDCSSGADLAFLNNKMAIYIELLSKIFELNMDNITLLYPWHRTFEVEVNL